MYESWVRRAELSENIMSDLLNLAIPLDSDLPKLAIALYSYLARFAI